MRVFFSRLDASQKEIQRALGTLDVSLGRDALEIVFKCPECSGQTKIEMSKRKAAKIKQDILSEGRSPLFIIHCENEHELVITFYNLRSGEGLGVRDVVVAYRLTKESLTKKKSRKKK